MEPFDINKAYGVWYDKTHPSDFVAACRASAQRQAEGKRLIEIKQNQTGLPRTKSPS